MEINLDEKQDRAALMDALASKGLESYEEDTGGGFYLVTVELVPDNGIESLSVTASGIDQPCEIGLAGYRTVDGSVIECGSGEFVRAATLEHAVDTFQAFVGLRDAVINDLRMGKYDLS